MWQSWTATFFGILSPNIEVGGGSKKNVYSEVKYEYNKRNELVRMDIMDFQDLHR